MAGDPWDCVAIYVRELDQWKIRMEYWKEHGMY